MYKTIEASTKIQILEFIEKEKSTEKVIKFLRTLSIKNSNIEHKTLTKKQIENRLFFEYRQFVKLFIHMT